MGLCSSRPEVTEGAVIVDSVVISNSKARIHGDVVQIPIRSMASGESSVISIDKKGGVIRIIRGPIHGNLTHDEIVESIALDGQSKKTHTDRQSVQL